MAVADAATLWWIPRRSKSSVAEFESAGADANDSRSRNVSAEGWRHEVSPQSQIPAPVPIGAGVRSPFPGPGDAYGGYPAMAVAAGSGNSLSLAIPTPYEC